MMAWSILWLGKSARHLKEMGKKLHINGVEAIKRDPYTTVKRLKGSRLLRLRAGGYGVILDLQQEKLVIFVVETDNRESIYRQ